MVRSALLGIIANLFRHLTVVANTNHIVSLTSLVMLRGLEPRISGLKGQRVSQFHYSTINKLWEIVAIPYALTFWRLVYSRLPTLPSSTGEVSVPHLRWRHNLLGSASPSLLYAESRSGNMVYDTAAIFNRLQSFLHMADRLWSEWVDLNHQLQHPKCCRLPLTYTQINGAPSVIWTQNLPIISRVL